MEILTLLGSFCRQKTKPNKANSPGFARKSEAQNSKSETKKRDLKKQSQFDSGQIGVNSYMKGVYDNNPPCGARKKQSQSNPISDETLTD